MAPSGNRSNWLIRSSSALIIIATFIMFAVPATAAEPDIRLSIHPADDTSTAYFKVQAEPGETVQLAATLNNHGSSPVKATTFAADAFTMPNGGFGVEDLEAAQTGTTTWVTYETDTFDIGQGESITREFELTIPADTEPGDYVTSLVIQNADAIGATEGVSMKQVIRQFVAIAINVTGERSPAMSISGVSHEVIGGQSVITFDVANTGNKHLQPAGEFALRDASGTEVIRRDVTMAQFYAKTETTFSVTHNGLLAPGDYYASFRLTDPGTTATATFEEGIVTVPVVEVPQSVNADGTVIEPATTNAPVTFSEGPSMAMMLGIGAGCLVIGVALTVLVMRMRAGRTADRMSAVTISNDSN